MSDGKIKSDVSRIREYHIFLSDCPDQMDSIVENTRDKYDYLCGCLRKVHRELQDQILHIEEKRKHLINEANYAKDDETREWLFARVFILNDLIRELSEQQRRILLQMHCLQEEMETVIFSQSLYRSVFARAERIVDNYMKLLEMHIKR